MQELFICLTLKGRVLLSTANIVYASTLILFSSSSPPPSPPSPSWCPIIRCNASLKRNQVSQVDMEVMVDPLRLSRQTTEPAEGNALNGLPDTDENPDHLSELNASLHDYLSSGFILHAVD